MFDKEVFWKYYLSGVERSNLKKEYAAEDAEK